MLNRWIGIICALLMLSANTTLFVRDVLPGLRAGDPPELDELSRTPGPERRVQTGIFDADGRCVGRSWTIRYRQSNVLNVGGTTILHPVALPNGLITPSVRIEMHLSYREQDSLLGDLSMSIRGLPEGVTLRGEFVPPDSFACLWQLGHRQRGTFVLDAQATRALGDVLRPFDRLPGLYVGRTWRLQLLDPLSSIVPGLSQHGFLAEPSLVRVTGTDTIEHRGHPVEVFVVETQRMRAWATAEGDVLRQDVDLPLLGRLTLRDEPFDDSAFQDAKRWLSQPPDEG